MTRMARMRDDRGMQQRRFMNRAGQERDQAMIFTETKLPGAFLIEPECLRDERGFFARTWCQRELAAHGLEPRLAQCSVSLNLRRGTLRGMHFQAQPCPEVKLVRCTQGALYDVILDLRPDSVTFKHWVALELDARNHRSLYIPAGCAHGFQTLQDETEILYQISEFYVPELSRGARWNDPAFRIEWPLADPILSARDRAFPDFET
jgi:dTDP-4-dehydrorhamnose 3,5-epimerase